MAYFGISAQPGLGSSVWGNESWPARMAIATTPYSPRINEWNLVYREEGNHETIVSNVAHLSAEQEGTVLREAEARAVQQMEWPEALEGIQRERQVQGSVRGNERHRDPIGERKSEGRQSRAG